MNEIERIYPADGFARSTGWPDPTPEMLDTILFDTIWRVIKTWDINVPHAYSGYMGATGNHARAIYDAIAAMRGEPVRKYALGDLLTKTKGSAWTGRVVGFYSTKLTPIGYAIESENEPGSVQIYPESALEPASGKD